MSDNTAQGAATGAAGGAQTGAAIGGGWGAVIGAVVGGLAGGFGADAQGKKEEEAIKQRQARINNLLGRRQANVEKFGEDMAALAEREHAAEMANLQARTGPDRLQAQEASVQALREGTAAGEERVLSGLPQTGPAQSGLQQVQRSIDLGTQAQRAPTVALAENQARGIGGAQFDADQARQLNFDLTGLNREAKDLGSMFDIRDKQLEVALAKARQEAQAPLPVSGFGQAMNLLGAGAQAVAPMFAGGEGASTNPGNEEG
jgi:gas vesicle protein